MAPLPKKILAYLKHSNIYTDNLPTKELGASAQVIRSVLDELELDGKIEWRVAVSGRGGRCKVYDLLSASE